MKFKLIETLTADQNDRLFTLTALTENLACLSGVQLCSGSSLLHSKHDLRQKSSHQLRAGRQSFRRTCQNPLTLHHGSWSIPPGASCETHWSSSRPKIERLSPCQRSV